MAEHIAHVKQNADGKWECHSLADHALSTASLAKEFASVFGSEDWGWLAGLWHDLGKARPAFQKHIKKASGYDPSASISSELDANKSHASTGAMYARKFMRDQNVDTFGIALAYMIAGHHAGLPDFVGDDARGRSLSEALVDTHFLDEALAQDVPPELLSGHVPQSPVPFNKMDDIHLWIRMVFSALVDADFLDTEKFMAPNLSRQREATSPTMAMLLSHFNNYMVAKSQSLAPAEQRQVVNVVRNEVLAQARDQSRRPSGVYTMTVPTGGGKTLSSLAFALEHAVQQEKRRIIYAIPYTSIIEQTANEFTKIFDEFANVVLEHHSNIEPQEGKETVEVRLSAENWDTPLVVTTTVQLFESLFAAKPSRCRKLHNLANSVIVLDETQLLPATNLDPIRHVIRLLAEQYQVTFLMTTATPTPGTGTHDAFGKQLLRDIASTEIIENPHDNYRKLARVRFTMPSDFDAKESWEEIAGKIRNYPTSLTIVNRRQDARDLFLLMTPDESLFHLSALMCPLHRKRVIEEVKNRLMLGLPTRVISTQLVEAGVDFDFPVVFRAAAGLDSIIQAAGRCNREGKLKGPDGESALGDVFVFVPPTSPPDGYLTKALQVTTRLLKNNEREIDSPEVINEYFLLLHGEVGDFDLRKVLGALQNNAVDTQIQFRTAAQKFQMIEEGHTETVFIDYCDVKDSGPSNNAKIETDRSASGISAWLAMLAAGSADRWLIRKLQPYSISLYKYELPALMASGAIQETSSGFYTISGSGVYDEKLGFTGVDRASYDSIL